MDGETKKLDTPEVASRAEHPLDSLNEKFGDAIESMLRLTVELQNKGFIDTSKETKEVIGDLLTARYLINKHNKT